MPEETTVQDPVGVSGGELQQEMASDFFYDDGSDAVVDSMGNPQTDSEGNIYRSLDDFNNSNQGGGKQQQVDNKNQNGENGGQQTQKAGFDAAFMKDGSIDLGKVNETAAKLKGYSYQMRSTYRIPEGGMFQQPQQVDPKTRIKTSIETYRNELTAQRIEPIKSMWDEIQQEALRRGEQIPDYVFNVLDAKYRKAGESLTADIDNRRDELMSEILSEKSTDTEMKAFRQESSKNFRSAANDLIPHVPEAEREEVLSSLVFGHEGEGGKFVNGYGTDIVNALFDSAMDGKTFNSPDQWKTAYNNWWYKFSSKPENVSLIANIAFSRYVVANHESFRDDYRNSWEKELGIKKQNSNQQSRSAGAAGADAGNADALMQYHGFNR